MYGQEAQGPMGRAHGPRPRPKDCGGAPGPALAPALSFLRKSIGIHRKIDRATFPIFWGVFLGIILGTHLEPRKLAKFKILYFKNKIKNLDRPLRLASFKKY